MRTTLKYQYKFIDFPPYKDVHQGTGANITYSPWLVSPQSVTPDVWKPLTFQNKNWSVYGEAKRRDQLSIVVMCLTVVSPGAPNWYGIAFRAGIQSFTSVNIFCHPSPGTAGMADADYPDRTGQWPALFRYAQNLGFQLDAGDCNQILVVPFFSNASYGTGGIFPANWREVLFVVINGVKAAAFQPRPNVDLATLAQAVFSELQGGHVLPIEVENIVLSCFSYGRQLMRAIRQRMPGLEAFLREIWDFDGVGPGKPISDRNVKAILYDQQISNDLSSFHVPWQRWPAYPPLKVKSLGDAHGLIPNTLLWHSTTLSRVGK